MGIEALLFDVGGTVFDWRTAIVRAVSDCEDLARLDADVFSSAWRERSLVEIEEVAAEKVPRRPFDAVLESSLDHAWQRHGRGPLSQQARHFLMAAWEKMPAWPEVPDALPRLRSRFFVAPHTILSLRVAAHSSKNAGLSWDAVISCDSLGAVKPQPESYRRALAALGRPGPEVLFVAAHPSDLRAAQAQGMKAAYVVARLLDYGDNYEDTGFAQEFDFVASDFTDLANQLCL